MKLPDKLYNFLKWFLLLVVPAFITFLTALTMAWHCDIPLEAIVTTISATATFLGAIVGISTIQYNVHKEEAVEEFKNYVAENTTNIGNSEIEEHPEGINGDEV